jgi:hypothetical protein
MGTAKILVLSLGLAVCGASVAAAQSQPNFGPNAPSHGDSFGQPPSGASPPLSGQRAYRARAQSFNALQPHGYYHPRHYYRHHYYR